MGEIQSGVDVIQVEVALDEALEVVEFEGLGQAFVTSSGVGQFSRYFQGEDSLFDGGFGGLEGCHSGDAVRFVQLGVNLNTKI